MSPLPESPQLTPDREGLPPPVWDFIAGGAGDELTLAANRATLDGLRLVPRALRDVSTCDTSTTLFGRTISAPFAIAPIAYHELMSPALTWPDIETLRARTRLPLILKGILSTDDARRAVNCGADGIVVSNHGGRQLDGVAASAECLAAVRASVGQG